MLPNARGIIERSREIFNAVENVHAKDSYNENLRLWRLATGKTIEIASMQREDDKYNYQGRPYDLYVFDEATEFNESQVRFVSGWNRSTYVNKKTKKPQLCQVLLTFNPPMNETGQWVVRFFGPWLDPEHPNPAKDGEIRWFTTIAGEDEEIPEDDLLWYAPIGGTHRKRETGDPFTVEGRWVIPQRGIERDGVVLLAKSRTFFHAGLKDNPILEATGYGATIDALPEPLRSFLKGDFNAAKEVDPWQVIPLVWVQLAQKRWREAPKPVDVPLNTVGVDVAHGGKDKTVAALRYGSWLAPLHAWKGIETPDGKTAAAKVWPLLEGAPLVNVDAIGWGASCCERLQDDAATLRKETGSAPLIMAINVGVTSTARDKSGRYTFKNLRSELYWKFRELLDPSSGHEIALPPDQEMVADLCAARYEVVTGKIVVESKPDIKERIGRSPDKGDAVLLAFMEGRRIMVSAV